MRALFILIFSVTTMFVIGGGKVCSQHLSEHSYIKQLQKVFIKESIHEKQSSIAFHKGLTKEHIDITEYVSDIEEIVWSSHSISLIRNFALISYAIALIYLISIFKNRLNFQWNRTFPSSEKYILQRVLRL